MEIVGFSGGLLGGRRSLVVRVILFTGNRFLVVIFVRVFNDDIGGEKKVSIFGYFVY